MKLGDEADIEMQPDICAKEETEHVRIDVDLIRRILICADVAILHLYLITSYLVLTIGHHWYSQLRSPVRQ